MSDQPRLIFVNLPVSNLPASKRFYEHLGFGFDPRFEDETAACMVVNEGASYVMLLDARRFAEFTPRPVADAGAATEAIVCVSAADREEVDRLADAALQAGARPANDPMDHGFMYARSFCDLDGHLWEVMWMCPDAVEQGPPEMAETAA
jgi:predicted lactoylglutathione lyase